MKFEHVCNIKKHFHFYQHVTFLKRVSLVSQTVKNLPAMQEIWLLSLGQEDPLEKRMTTHSKTLDWRIPWIEEPGRLVHGVTESQTGLSY